MPNAQPKRCSWVNVDQVLMREYHDREWGVPAHDDRTHFEFLILEAAQAGLSWSIVSDIATFGGSASAANEGDPTAVRSTNDKCDAIVQERVRLSLLG